MSTPTLPPFPVDEETLNVIYDSMNRVVVGFDDNNEPIRDGSPFSLEDVLNMLSGYDPSLMVQAVNEYDQPIPDIYEYTGPGIYHQHDLIRALIDEIRRLRSSSAHPIEETKQ